MVRRKGGATVRDVAKRANVSLSTVSNALNFPERLAPETLTKVHDAIAELGFVRNEAARQLRLGESRVFGMVVIDSDSPFFGALARSVEDAADALGYSVLIGNAAQDPERERRYIQLFEAQRVEGLFVTPIGDDTGEMKMLSALNMPVVLVDALDAGGQFPAVTVNHEAGGRAAARHLLEMGRRRIALVSGPVQYAQVSARNQGAADEIACCPDAEVLWIEASQLTLDGGMGVAVQLTDLPANERPDALFAPNDLVALGITEILRSDGSMKIPEDIAVVGYDDVPFSRSARIPLTSVRQPLTDIGIAAVELMMEEKKGGPTRTVSFAPQLITRTSTAGI